MRALRSGGATFFRACKSPGQIPARAHGTNDNRPSFTDRRYTIFIPLRGLAKAIGDSGGGRNPAMQGKSYVPILRFDAALTGTVWVLAADIQAVANAAPDLQGRIAFARAIS